jgi:hypothetical protein
MRQTRIVFVLAAALLAAVGTARAQEDSSSDEAFLAGEQQPAEPQEPAGETGAGEGDEEIGEEEAFLTGQQTEEQKLLAEPETEAGTTLAEDPETPFFSVGGRFRWLVIPDWFIGMFGVDIKYDSALLINNLAGGAEFTYRKDGFDITAAVWFAGLGWDGYISFKGSGEEHNSWEVVENDIKSLLLTVDFIWSTDIVDWFAVTYGAGLGLGIPFGDIIRTEATQVSGGTRPCSGPGGDAWCNQDEEYNEIYDLPTGIIPWVNLLAGMRFKPHRHVAIYVDTGFGLGFQAGVRAGYIF